MLIRVLLASAMAALLPVVGFSANPPLALHPDNPHYFLFRGKPAVLIGSGEHYGAVLNLDFNYGRYLDALAACGLNHTRTFSGAYCEAPGAFKIAQNTLAPGPGRFIAPWARSGMPGCADGGNKFDLGTWDEAYFKRLKDFVAQASKRGVVVEFNLFCPFYEDSMWRLSPMNAANNTAGIGAVARTNVYTLDRNGGLLEVQEALVRKIAAELNAFDNLYYEVCNEPYFGGVTEGWQRHIADTIAAAESALPNRHLISMNIANGAKKVERPHPSVSILNFHYASPPKAVAMNYDLGRVIGDNETGFKGTGDLHYRMEAWEFLLAGGALYSHLDYSFAVGHEDGSFAYPPTQPGGGNAGFRQQMKVLTDFIRRFEFVKMKPDDAFIRGVTPPARARALAEPGRQYAVYVFGGTQTDLTLDLPRGRYKAEWVNTRSGAFAAAENLEHQGGQTTLTSPPYVEDIALRIIEPRAMRREHW
jgi:hypothetical protein